VRFINKPADGGVTALHMAALNGHFECVQLLLELGASTLAVTFPYGTSANLIGTCLILILVILCHIIFLLFFLVDWLCVIIFLLHPWIQAQGAHLSIMQLVVEISSAVRQVILTSMSEVLHVSLICLMSTLELDHLPPYKISEVQLA
jgi:Ankyrin repeats (many copies)